MFLLDVSGSIRHSRFRDIQAYVIDVVDKLEVNTDRTRVGVMKFSDEAAVEFYLDGIQVSLVLVVVLSVPISISLTGAQK